MVRLRDGKDPHVSALGTLRFRNRRPSNERSRDDDRHEFDHQSAANTELMDSDRADERSDQHSRPVHCRIRGDTPGSHVHRQSTGQVTLAGQPPHSECESGEHCTDRQDRRVGGRQRNDHAHRTERRSYDDRAHLTETPDQGSRWQVAEHRTECQQRDDDARDRHRAPSSRASRAIMGAPAPVPRPKIADGMNRDVKYGRRPAEVPSPACGRTSNS